MATLKPVIVPAKALKDGKHKIRISVSHNGETRYIVTNIILDSAKEFKSGTIVKRGDASYLNTKLRGILQYYQEILDDLQYIEGLTCAELIELMKTTKTNKNCTLKEAYDEYISSSRAMKSTIGTYATAWHTITKYVNPNMQVTQITYGTLLALEKSFKARKLSNSTVHNYMGVLSAVVNYAKKCGYVYFKRDPFLTYRRPMAEIRQAWLTVEEVKRLRDTPLEKKHLDRCRNIILLSYYLGGINITDLIDINFNEQKERIKYVRKKTKNIPKVNPYVEFDIPDEAKDIINKLKDKDGHLRLSGWEKKDCLHHTFTHATKPLANIIGVPRLVYYSARKSFSQHAFNLGIDSSVIEYILGHNLKKDGSSLFHYVYVTPEMATNAIRKVLDNLK